MTPYQFASNRPIDGIDMDGLEYVKFSENPIEWIYQFGQGFFKGEGGAYNLVDGFNRNANPIGIAAHGTYSALKYEPTLMTPVTINQGSTLRVGTAAPVQAFEAKGGGFQMELLKGEVTYVQSISLKK